MQGIAVQEQRQAERVRTLLAAWRSPNVIVPLSRPGISVATPVRYATNAAPSEWMSADRGRPIVDAVLDAVGDGQDRVVLAWPTRIGGGFVAAAVALREARASGRLAHATLGFWPWRRGTTWPSRSVLVHPEDIARGARKAATEAQSGAAWMNPRLAHKSLCLLELRLGDLVAARASDQRDTGVAADGHMVIRSPTLLETTAVFAPDESGAVPYKPDGDQVLRRVRDYTHMGDRHGGLENHVAAIGDPLQSPFAIFGMPPAPRAEALQQVLGFSRFDAFGLDVVIVDVTRTGRSEMPDDWERPLSALLQALAHTAGRRPPVVVLAEDAFAMRKAVRTLRSHNAAMRPARRLPIEVGAFLPQPGMFGSGATLASELPAIAFEADIKDAALAGIRRDLVTLGRTLRQAGAAVAADATSKALAFLRRAASCPIGLNEATAIADILYDADDEVDGRARSLFRPKMALSHLAAVQDIAPASGEAAQRLIHAIEAKASGWAEETPVSAKLQVLMADPGWNSASTLLAVYDRRAADIFLGSDRALNSHFGVVDHRSLEMAVTSQTPKRIIVIGPTPEAARTLLTTPLAPERVLLLGDAAGTGLLAAEIAPLARIGAFASVAARADALAKALHRGGSDEKLDLAEAEFRIAAAMPEGEIDLTQAGDAYRGDILLLTTSRGHRVRYRPNSDVLRFSPGEVRPFERIHAQEVAQGDRVLVLNEAVREPIRRALAGSRENLKQLSLYHERIAEVRRAMPDASEVERARRVFAAMQILDPGLGAHELQNIGRWLTADQAPARGDGTRQPRAARDWPRFRLFMQAVGVNPTLAAMYWRSAIVPSRSYRAQEGYLFNQRIVQFVLDPEGAASGASAWKDLQGLWQLVLDAVDEVTDITTIRQEGSDG